jgi:hypothetical protein
MRVVHTVEGSANIVQRGTDQTRKRDNDWCLTRTNDFVVNEKAEGRILEHGGNVTGDAIGSQAGKDTGSRKFAKKQSVCRKEYLVSMNSDGWLQRTRGPDGPLA